MSIEAETERIKVFYGNYGRWIDAELKSPRWQLALAPEGKTDQTIVILDSRLFPDGESVFRKLNLPFIMADGDHFRGTQGKPINVYFGYILFKN